MNRFDDGLVCSFLQILKQNFCWFSPSVWRIKGRFWPNWVVYFDPCIHVKLNMLSMPVRNISKNVLSKLAKNNIPNIVKSINFHSVASIWWCLVCSFLSIIKTKLLFIFPKSFHDKNIWFYMDSNFKMPPQKIFFLYSSASALRRNINQSFFSKLPRKCIPNIINLIKNYENYSIWWCLA